jgi:hypothetical protein
MKEPLWRRVLCWGAVVTFLTLPLFVFVLVFISTEFTWAHFDEHISHYKFLAPFYQSVTALIFGLAGLNTFDRHAMARNEAAQQKPNV